MYDLVRNTFEYFFSIVSGYSAYEVKNTKRSKTLIENFINLLPEETGEDWLFNYFAFQFFRYHDKKTRFGKGVVQLNWVVGEKALKAWRDMTEEQRFLVDEFLNKNKIQNPRQIKSTPISNEFYENEKKRFFNTNLGRVNCFEFELKYDSKSDLCNNCKYKEVC